MRLGLADVAALMLLGVEPAGLASPQLDSALNTVGRDHSREVGQRNHHAVWVAVQMGRIARPIPILQNANPMHSRTRHGIDLDRSLRDRSWLLQYHDGNDCAI